MAGSLLATNGLSALIGNAGHNIYFYIREKNNYIIQEPTVNWIGHLNDSTTFSMANFH
jgi:hypothetical protein